MCTCALHTRVHHTTAHPVPELPLAIKDDGSLLEKMTTANVPCARHGPLSILIFTART